MNKNEESPVNAGNVEVFNFCPNKSAIRVQMINGEPWFVAKDVCQVLGIANHKDAVSRLDEDERQGVGITDPLGIRQTANAVSESGLYSLIFQSRKPEAKKFRKWVTSEVLPAIRKTGFYGVRRMADGSLDMRDQPYTTERMGDRDVRTLEVNGEKWYMLSDVRSSLGAQPRGSRSARQLNVRQTLANKVLVYGIGSPVWFVKELGVRLLKCSSRTVRSGEQLTLDFGQQ